MHYTGHTSYYKIYGNGFVFMGCTIPLRYHPLKTVLVKAMTNEAMAKKFIFSTDYQNISSAKLPGFNSFNFHKVASS